MDRSVEFLLNRIGSIPCSLRESPRINSPASSVNINLGTLFLQYYFDSYPTAPPKPDPSRFEYLDLISSSSDFRLHSFILSASIVKKRAISTELGQAFCRLMLQEHFGVLYFAHMTDVLNKPSHAAMSGLRIRRIQAGDVPDYLCARKSPQPPVIAEAKGRFSSISFSAPSFQDWRDQFSRITVIDRSGHPRKIKGFIVATRFATEGSRHATCIYVEDPDTSGNGSLPEYGNALLHRVAVAMHYSRVFQKLDLLPVASALQNGFSLARELLFRVPVWTCMVPPFQGVQFIGGFYRTLEGRLPQLTEEGWQMNPELGQGHAVFIGLLRDASVTVARAARGDWDALDDIPSVNPEGSVSSEFTWLPDGTVAAPLTYFLPTGVQII